MKLPGTAKEEALPGSFMYKRSVLVSVPTKHTMSFHSATLLHLLIHSYYTGQLVGKQAFILPNAMVPSLVL